MPEQIECMCVHCGISVYLDMDLVSLDDGFNPAVTTLNNLFCTECGGQLTVVGKAGEEPHYRLK
jgi:hypothetical protein